MSNTAYLMKMKFEKDREPAKWGWLLADDRLEAFTDIYTKDEIPQSPLKLLAKVLSVASELEFALFARLLASQRGMMINGSWHEFGEIGPVLLKALREKEG